MQEMAQFTLASFLFAVLSLVCFLASASSVRRARDESRKAQRALDELTLVQDSLDVLRTAVKRTEGRVVKAASRLTKSTASDDVPDPKTHPEEWKQWQNRALANRRNIQ